MTLSPKCDKSHILRYHCREMRLFKEESVNLSVVLPCLDEGEALLHCIKEAEKCFRRLGIQGEIIVADNGSRDDSRSIAVSSGAALAVEKRRGYGFAIRKGLSVSRGTVIIICDADGTYDLSRLDSFYFPLAENRADMVIGNRFAGSIERGAMPLSHRLGSGFLSLLGRARFSVRIRDFHCGLRSVRRDALSRLDFKTGGMEFATEFIGLAANKGLRIREVPTDLRRSRFKRRSKLNVFRDGFRHLGVILGFPRFSPFDK